MYIVTKNCVCCNIQPLWMVWIDERSLLRTIRRGQMEFLGHIVRKMGMSYWPERLKEQEVDGRQRKTLLGSLKEYMGAGTRACEVSHTSRNRRIWNMKVAHAVRHGTWKKKMNWWKVNVKINVNHLPGNFVIKLLSELQVQLLRIPSTCPYHSSLPYDSTLMLFFGV